MSTFVIVSASNDMVSLVRLVSRCYMNFFSTSCSLAVKFSSTEVTCMRLDFLFKLFMLVFIIRYLKSFTVFFDAPPNISLFYWASCCSFILNRFASTSLYS